jgi:hypothetical protein
MRGNNGHCQTARLHNAFAAPRKRLLCALLWECCFYAISVYNADMRPALPLLPLAPSCATGSLLRREKRFSVECLVDGQPVWAHTNN